MSKKYNTVPLSEVLTHYQDYIDEPDPIIYPKLSVKLYGKGVILDTSVDGSNLKMKKHQIAKKGQVILSEIWGKKGAIGIVPPEGEGALCTGHFFLFDIQDHKIDRKYLQTIFTANYLEEQLNSEAQGTTGYAAVRPKHLLAATIPLPSLEEQRRIIARIEELAAKIEEARGLRREAVGEAEKLYAAMLGQEYDMAVNEVGKTERLEELCFTITDGTHVTPTYVAEGVPFLSVKDITTGTINFENTRLISEEEHKFFTQRCKPERDDILLTKIGTTGFAKVIDVDREFSIFVSLALLKLDKRRLVPKYTEYMLNSPRLRKYSKEGTRGVGNKNLVLKFIKDFPMPSPSIDYQNQVVARLDDLQIELNLLKQKQSAVTAELDALIPSILDRAFKGEL